MVADDEAGLRLDKWLKLRLQDVSRSRVQQLIADECLKCNGQLATNVSAKVKLGDSYSLIIPEVEPLELEPVKMDLDIVFEDEHMIVINKPAGLTVHPATTTSEPTLVHGLLAHCGKSLSGIGGVARPGIVHRIDKDTSGLLVVAKHDKAHAHLSEQLKSRTLSRTYLAYCWDMPNPAQGSIEGNIARSQNNRKKMAVVESGGKPAITHYKMESLYKHNSIPVAAKLVCKLETGRTHQIRVHFSHIGHALIGDPLYGSSTSSKINKNLKSADPETVSFLQEFNRQALHAHKLALNHPDTDEEMSFEVKPPSDMINIEKILKTLH